MRIMKTGEPCPCCGQAIPAMLPVDKRLLASIVAEGLAIQDAVRTVEHGVVEGQEAMPTLTPPNEPERAGLYGKYTVYKNKDGSLVTDCFILRPAKDPAAVAALRAYAAATDNAELSADIINWVGAEPNEPLTLEDAKKERYIWFTPLNDWAKVTPFGVLFFGSEELITWETLCEEWGYRFKAYHHPPEGEADA